MVLMTQYRDRPRTVQNKRRQIKTRNELIGNGKELKTAHTYATVELKMVLIVIKNRTIEASLFIS
jgi:hypothetical protein